METSRTLINVDDTFIFPFSLQYCIIIERREEKLDCTVVGRLSVVYRFTWGGGGEAMWADMSDI